MEAVSIVEPIDILMIEDNPGDVRLTTEALRDSKLCNRLHTVGDGAQALAYLRREKGYEQTQRPDLILLDLNLPKLDGREVLRQIKEDKSLRRIPVVVITSSAAEQDILRSYDLYANCYVCKPVNLDQFITVVKSVENFWVSIVKLP